MSSFEPLEARAERREFGPLGAGDAGAAAPPPVAAPPLPDLRALEERSERERERAALQELESFRREAFEAGRAYERAQGEDRVREELERLAGAWGEIERFRAELAHRYAAALLDLAFDVAAKITAAELERDPRRWEEMIRRGIRRSLDRERVRLRAGEALAGALAERRDALREGLAEVKALEIVPDPALGPLECIVETPGGELDLGVGSQVATLREAVREGE